MSTPTMPNPGEKRPGPVTNPTPAPEPTPHPLPEPPESPTRHEQGTPPDAPNPDRYRDDPPGSPGNPAPRE